MPRSSSAKGTHAMSKVFPVSFISEGRYYEFSKPIEDANIRLHLESPVLADKFEFGFMESVET
jgi:hypothetical protein